MNQSQGRIPFFDHMKVFLIFSMVLYHVMINLQIANHTQIFFTLTQWSTIGFIFISAWIMGTRALTCNRSWKLIALLFLCANIPLVVKLAQGTASISHLGVSLLTDASVFSLEVFIPFLVFFCLLYYVGKRIKAIHLGVIAIVIIIIVDLLPLTLYVLSLTSIAFLGYSCGVEKFEQKLKSLPIWIGAALIGFAGILAHNQPITAWTPYLIYTIGIAVIVSKIPTINVMKDIEQFMAKRLLILFIGHIIIIKILSWQEIFVRSTFGALGMTACIVLILCCATIPYERILCQIQSIKIFLH